MNPGLLLLSVALISLGAQAGTKRSQSAKVEFKQQQHCPATGSAKGPCKGYVIDHTEALSSLPIALLTAAALAIAAQVMSRRLSDPWLRGATIGAAFSGAPFGFLVAMLVRDVL